MNARLLKGFAGAARFGLKLVTFSLILVLFAFIFSAIAADISISSGSVATSIGAGVVTVGGDQISKNDTQELYNFTLTVAGNVSNITIIVPSYAVSANYANVSVLNTTVVQLGTNLTNWIVTYVANFTTTGDPLRIQINTSTLTAMLGADNATSNTVWFAFNATPKIPANTTGNVSDNHTMTWEVYIGNETSFSAVTKLTTLVDNKVPNIFNVIPRLNSTRQSYLGGTSADLFQVNVSEANLNVSSSTRNDGSVNVTLWIKKLVPLAPSWSKQTLLCYNATGGFKPNNPTNNLYTCNTTLDLTSGGFVGTLAEGNIVGFFFNSSDTVLNVGYNGTQDYPLNATVDRTSPTSTNVLSNVSYAKNTTYVTLSARFSDTYDLANATLGTNESGTWTNYTANETSIGSSAGSYGSPWDMGTTTAYNVNFTWKNDSIITDTIVGWQIRATDEAGNQHTTALQTFVVDVTAPAVGIISHTTRQNVTGTITVNVSVNDTTSGVGLVIFNISNSSNRAIGGLLTMSAGVSGYYNVSYNMLTLADGNYTIRIYSNDTIDNVNDTQTLLIQADNVAPTIRTIEPAANANISGTVNITAEINDVIWVSYVQYRISNATGGWSLSYIRMINTSGINMTNSGYYNATNVTSLLGDGVYNITIWANDSVNNIAQTNVSVYIDNNAPTLINLDTTLNVANVTSPASGTQYIPGRSYTFNISVTDNIGVHFVLARINSTNYTATRYGDVSGRTQNFSISVTDLAALAAGHDIIWYINDTSKNTRTENVWKYVIALNTSAFANLTVNATTIERGTSFNITAKGMTLAGFVSELNASIYANTTGTFALAALIPLKLANGASNNITMTSSLPVGPYNITANISLTENYTLNATVHSIIVNVVDTTAPPVVLLNASSSPTYVNGTIRKTGGTITLNVSAFENENGWGFPNNLTVNVYVNVTNGAQVFIGNLTNTSGYGHYSPTEVGGTITIPGGLTDGNLTLNFTVADLQGNIGYNDTSKRSNFVISIDNTAPALSGSVPLNSTFNKGTATELFQINVTEVNLNSSQNITLYWGFTPTTAASRSKTLLCTGTGANPYNFVGSNWICNTTLDLTMQADGESVYYFFNTSNATHPGGDLAGNTGSYGNVLIPLNSTVDRAVPSVGVLLPLGSANVSGSFTLNISANNTPGGISNVSYRITNNTFQSEMILLTRGAGTAYNGYWNGTNNTVIAGLADGRYRININATDFTGWQNTTINVTIFIDNTKPNVTIVTPTAKLNYSASILMNVTVRDSGIAYDVAAGDLKTVEYRLSSSSWGGSWIALTNTSTNGLNFDYYNATNDTSANFADGAYNITIKATDYADNFNDTQNVTIYIDRTAPAVSIKGPTANQYIKGVFNITAEINDAVWVKNVWYRISNGTGVLDVLGSDYLKLTNNSVTMNATNGGYYNATNITNAVVFGDGLYNITVAANDTLNQVTYANVTIYIDNNAPVQFGITTNTSEPASGTQYVPGTFYRFNKTFNDTIGVTSVILQVNATNRTAFRYEGDAQGGNWSANVTDLAANATGYPIIWYAGDATGNWLKTTQWYYVIEKNTSAFTTISINQTTVERGNFVNITIRSTIRAEINTTIYTNYSGVLASLTTFVPYPLNSQNITFTGMLKGIWNITANTTTTENYTANATLESVTFSVTDTGRPALRIYDYVNGTSVKPGDTIRLNISITDNYGIDSAFNVSVYLNGTTIGSWVFAGNISNSTFSSNASSAWANGTVTIPTSGMNVAGNRTINITILDSSSNLGMNDSFVINMDPGAPTWTTNSTTPGSNIEYFPGRTYYFNVTLTDEPLGVGTVFLEFNGTNYTASRFGGTIYSGNWSVSITDLAANTSVTGYRFRWYMNDTFNQWNTSDWLNYTIYKNTSAYAILSVNVSVAERGTYINITSYQTIRAEINTTTYANFSAFALSTINIVPYPAGNQNITYVGNNLAVGPYNITANTSESQNYTFNSSVQSVVITVQDSAPVSLFRNPANSSNASSTFLINVSVTDAGGVDMVRYNMSNITHVVASGTLNNTANAASHYNATVTVTSISDGNYNLTILANDTFGNLNSSYYFAIAVDRTAPTVIFNYNGTINADGFAPFNSTYRRGVVSINFTVSDVYAGINNNTILVRIGNLTHWQGPVVYAVNGTLSIFNFTNMTTVLADGLYNFTVTANDTQGNTITNATFARVDNTAPSLYANTTGNKDATNESQDITVTMFDAQTNATLDLYYRYAYPPAGISTQWYYAKLTGTVGSATVYRTAANITLVGGGRSIEYYVVGTDNATNAISNVANNASYPLGYFNITSVDSVSPVFTEIGANQSVVRSGQTVLITFKASETLSTYPVVTLNNVYYANRTSNGTNLVYTYNYTIQGSEGDGPATISVTGTDTAGNSGTSTCVSGSNCTGANSGFVIDAKAPAVTIWSPISGNFNTLSVGITATTDENAECRYDETSVAYASMSYAMAGAGTAHSATVNASQGTNTLYARCQDTAGNANTTSATISFTVDSLAPSIVTGGPNGTRTSSSVTLQANTSEPGTCKYGSQDVLFESMDAVMTGTGTAHTAALAGLLDSRASIYYVRCNDTSVPVNMMNASAVIQFGVDTRGNFNLTRPSTWADYFTSGWNRIALTQTELENTSITTYNMTNVLDSLMEPTYFTILYFNNASTASTWVSYAPGRAVNDLTLFNNQDPAKEYLVYVNATSKRLQIN